MAELKIRRVGNSSGVVLPKEMMARLRVAEGDTLFVTETPNGYRIEPHDPVVERQVEATWMSLDNGLHHWLVALRARIVKTEAQRHDEFLPRRAN